MRSPVGTIQHRVGRVALAQRRGAALGLPTDRRTLIKFLGKVAAKN
jgi:hypothetical protein